jgi:hypothetical protein
VALPPLPLDARPACALTHARVSKLRRKAAEANRERAPARSAAAALQQLWQLLPSLTKSYGHKVKDRSKITSEKWACVRQVTVMQQRLNGAQEVSRRQRRPVEHACRSLCSDLLLFSLSAIADVTAVVATGRVLRCFQHWLLSGVRWQSKCSCATSHL